MSCVISRNSLSCSEHTLFIVFLVDVQTYKSLALVLAVLRDNKDAFLADQLLDDFLDLLWLLKRFVQVSIGANVSTAFDSLVGLSALQLFNKHVDDLCLHNRFNTLLLAHASHRDHDEFGNSRVFLVSHGNFPWLRLSLLHRCLLSHRRSPLLLILALIGGKHFSFHRK